jgi:hypothetical protein
VSAPQGCVDSSAAECEMSARARVDNSASERLEMSALCVDNSAAKLEHLEMSRPFKAPDNSVAVLLQMSGSGSRTVDNSAACDLRLSGLSTDDIMPVGHRCSCAFCGEHGQETCLPNCSNKQLVVGSAPTLVVSDKVAGTVNGSDSRVAHTLVA